MGKGGTPPSSQTVTQTNLPDYVRPQFEDLLRRADAESKRAYQTYGGDRRTGLTGGQQQALSMAENVAKGGVGLEEQKAASAGLTGAAGYTPDAVGYGYNPERALQGTQYTPGSIGSSYVAGAGPGAFQAGQISGAYDPSQISSQYQAQAVTPTYQAREITPSYQAGTISSSYNPQASDFESRAFTDPGVASQYMNPFVENVIDRQSAKMRQQFQETQAPQMASQAVQSGAFGGSRAAIQQGLAREKLEDRIADFQAQQRLQGFQQGQQAFQQDRARALQAQQMRDQAARAAGQLGVSAQEAQERARAQAGQMGLSAQEASERARMQAGQMGLSAQEASERARQQQAQMRLSAQQAMAQEQRAAAQLGLTGQQAQEEARARAAQLGQSGYQMSEQARQKQAQLGIAGQTAQEQARQQAAKQALAAQDAARQAYAQRAQIGLQSGQLGLSGAQQRAAAAAQLGQQGDRRQAFGARRADIMRQAAGIRQSDQQEALDLAYSDFLNQRDFPRQQINYMSGILRGVPVSPTMETTKYAAQPNIAQQMMGFGLGGMGLMRGLGGR